MKIYKSNISLLKNDPIKFNLKNHTTTLIKFKDPDMCTAFSEQIKENVSIEYTNVDFLGTCHINAYQGDETPQLYIEDFEIKNVGWDF